MQQTPNTIDEDGISIEYRPEEERYDVVLAPGTDEERPLDPRTGIQDYGGVADHPDGGFTDDCRGISQLALAMLATVNDPTAYSESNRRRFCGGLIVHIESKSIPGETANNSLSRALWIGGIETDPEYLPNSPEHDRSFEGEEAIDPGACTGLWGKHQ